MMTSRIFTLFILTLLTGFIILSGCTDENKTTVMDAISPVVIVKGSAQYCKQIPLPADCEPVITPTANITQNISYVIVEPPTTIPTPKPTVTVEPTSTYKLVDAFNGGERYEGQWFRWRWENASGLQKSTPSANRGIVVYGHSYHDGFTQWNDAWGNYQFVVPPAGTRFLAVYVHEEDFGPTDTGTWGYGASYFYLQYGQDMTTKFISDSYNPIYHLVELEDTKNNYYDIERLKPFGMHRVYVGMQAAGTGGYELEEYYSLRTGRGNSWDGFILYVVPLWVTDSDIRIVGNFAGKSVNWRFDRDIKLYPVSQIPDYNNLPTPTEAPRIKS